MRYIVKASKLSRRHYCSSQVDKFKQVFPGNAAFTLKNLLHAQRKGLNVLHVFDCAILRLRRHHQIPGEDRWESPVGARWRFTPQLSKKIGRYDTLINNWPIIYEWHSWFTPSDKRKWRNRMARAERTLKLLWKDKLFRRFLREEIAVRDLPALRKRK